MGFFSSVGCQESIHGAVPYDQTRNLQTRLLHKFRAEVDVKSQIIDSDLQLLQHERRRVTRKPRRIHFFRGRSEPKDGNTGHC